jgi:hypothetical protein
MKNLLFTVFLSIPFFINAQSQKQLITSFTSQQQYVKIEVKANIEVKHWDKPYVRLFTYITSTVSQEILDHLFSSGLYNYSQEVKDDKLIIRQLKKSNINQTIKIEVYLPENTELIKESL